MQYSSNSDAGIRALIRACPTPIGQYRQAQLQMRDRLQAIESFERTKRKIDLQATILRAKLEKQSKQCPEDLNDRAIWQAEMSLVELEFQELQQNLSWSLELVGDALREIECCRDEITRINTEAGVDLGELNQAEFQALMDGEFHAKRVRWITARTLAAQMGIAPEAAEVLLELSSEERKIYMENHGTILRGVHAEIDELVESDERLLSGSN